MTKVFAHRGASGYAPENTLEAFELAERQGADGIELDVHLSRDGEIVVTHDERIDRVSSSRGAVRDLTLRELKHISFHNGMNAYLGASIPTLREVLEQVKPGRMEVNIELKTGVYWYPGIEEKTVELVHKLGMEERVVYSSFNHASIAKIRSIDPPAQTAWLFSDVILNVDEYAKNCRVDGLHPPIRQMYMSDFMQRWTDSGLKVRVWTVNREDDMKKLFGHGLEALIGNYPDVALRVRKSIEQC